MGDTEGSELDDIRQKFSQDFGLYTISKLIPGILGAITLIYFTRVFSPTSYGHYALAITFVTILSTLSFGWLKQSILRFNTELKEDRLLENVNSIFILTSTIIITLSIAVYYLIHPSLGWGKEFYFASIALVICQGLFEVFSTLYQARLQSSRVTLYTVLRSIFRLVFAVLLAIIVLHQIVGWIWGAAIASLICAAGMIWNVYERRPSASFNFSLALKFIVYGFPLIGWLLGLTILNFADRILINTIQGSAAVGIYSANYDLVRRGILLAFTPLIQAIHPLVMSAWDGSNESQIQDMITGFTRYFVIIGAPATVLAAVLSYPLSTQLLAEGYQDGYVIIPIISAGLFLWNVSMIGHKGMEVLEKTNILFIGIVGSVVSNIVLNILLISPYGYFGAAVATLISFGGYTVYVYIVSRSLIPWVLPWRTLRNVGLGIIVMITPATWVYLSGGYTLVRIIITSALGCGLYGLVLYLVGELMPSELSIVVEYLP